MATFPDRLRLTGHKFVGYGKVVQCDPRPFGAEKVYIFYSDENRKPKQGAVTSVC